ncbi:MAG: transposase family protein [Defluviitaleaceae bacterium]|nr:transposase family protein [Defluviitaleaceae bacterium]
MTIAVNDVLFFHTDEKEYRVLWLSDEYAWLIALFGDSLPEPRSLRELEEHMQSGAIERRVGEPLLNSVAEEDIPERDRSFRDTVWGIIGPLVTNEPAIYDRKSRGALIAEALEINGITKKTMYKYLKWYWTRGKNKNALLPGFKNRGGKGVSKSTGDRKIGRPRKYTDTTGKNVDADTKRVFEQAVKRFYHTRREHTFTAVYELMLKEYYTERVILADGAVQMKLRDADELPTIGQFRYWYSKTCDQASKLAARKGEKTFSLQHRAILGKSDTNVIGPGSQYQIDATVGDIYLVSRFNRANIIGRPVIYFVIDVFSRMVAGMYVGLEGPSWAGAMMALANAATGKVGFCEAYGIEITEEQWPCRYIPDTILADRGEMESKSVETLVNALNVRVDNTPPYRADMKGIVEQYFRTINTKTTVFLPGHVKPDMMQRGGKDYRLDAKLDIFQFTKIMIQCALNHNNEHYLEGYERQENMIADDVLPIPIHLWNWGIVHRSGRLRSVSEDTVKLCLMPADTALVTAKGIRFKGMVYLCEKAVREHWFETARAKGSFRVNISYDSRNMSRIYLRLPDGAGIEPCFLADWETKYQQKCLDEIIALQALEKGMRGKNTAQELQSRIDLNAEIEKVVKESEDMARQTAVPASKRERTGNIRENRGAEKQLARQAEAFVLGDESEPAPVPVPIEEEISPTLAMIQKKLEERLSDK